LVFAMTASGEITAFDLGQAARRLADIVRIAAVVASSDEFAGKWCESVSAARSFFENESAKAREVCILPTRAQKPGELVRVYWDHWVVRPARLNSLISFVWSWSHSSKVSGM
jgi:hypothetical protein